MSETRRVASDGHELCVHLAGPEDGPLVLALHGFPESWYAWRHQLAALVAAGYRVAMPDQRGYGDSDKPTRVEDYHLDRLSGDAVAIVDALGREDAALLAHDWGGVVAWWTAHKHPGRVRRLAALAAPHPAVFLRALRTPPQVFKSWYVFFFQLPGAPEWLLGLEHQAAFERILTTTSSGGFDDDDLAHFRASWSKPGCVHAMLNWYRALLQLDLAAPEGAVKPPALILWGEGDEALGVELADRCASMCERASVVKLPGIKHWVQHEAPAEVNRRVLEFFARDGGKEAGDP
jgi:pimeloyl-ACP methyl ester carboxylesterase